MTDLELFQQMIRGTGSDSSEPLITMFGENVAVSFKVGAGIAGSSTAFALAFFRKDTGKFIGFHWDD
jgi:hypothetical protein